VIRHQVATGSPPVPDTRVAALARVVTGMGAVAMIGGMAAWLVVRAQLVGERIRIPGSSKWLPGRPVGGPIGAFAQAEAIKSTALGVTGGKTYGELPEGDENAGMVMNASLLRSSLFTSVLAFGLAAAVAGTGGMLMLIGSALFRLARPGRR
jgi:hypothetical protein